MECITKQEILALVSVVDRAVCRIPFFWLPGGALQALVDAADTSGLMRVMDLQDFGQGQAAFPWEFKKMHSNIKNLGCFGAVEAVYY